MIELPKALHAWNTPEFNAVLKDEIEQLDGGLLPLQQGLSQGSHVTGRFSVMIIGVSGSAGGPKWVDLVTYSPTSSVSA